MQIIFIALDGCDSNRAAGKPGALEFGEDAAFDNQGTHPGGITKDFIKGHADKIGFDAGQIERVCGHISRHIQKDIPAFLMGQFDPIQGMLDAGKIGLGWIGE